MTYQEFERYWRPVAARAGGGTNGIAFVRWLEGAHKLVVSQALEKLTWPRASTLASIDEIARLQTIPGSNLIVFGSPSLAASLTAAGLIDEFRLMVHPHFLGRGRPLFDALGLRRKLRLVGSRALPSGVLSLALESLSPGSPRADEV